MTINVQNRIQKILSQLNLQKPSEAFTQALIQNSNSENDWLWYAELHISDVERQYCLERALRINPENRRTQKQLNTLSVLGDNNEPQRT